MSQPTATKPRVLAFYDYVCPYAYVGHHRAKRIREALGLDVVFLPWEIHPQRSPRAVSRAAPAPGWVDGLAAELGLTLRHPSRSVNSNLALRGAEYAKDQGREVHARYQDLVFDALWQEDRDISDERVLADIAKQAGMEPDPFLVGIRHHAYQWRLDEVDRAATRLGVQRVPTFVFGDQRVVGNDPLEGSLLAPLRAFLKRWDALGEDGATTLEDDLGLEGFR